MQRKRFTSSFAADFIFHTNALEGSRLTEAENLAAVQKGAITATKEADSRVAVNHVTALKYAESLVELGFAVTEEDLLFIHRLLFEGILEDAGSYRKTQVAISGADFLPPPPQEVQKEVGMLLRWAARNLRRLEPAIFAAEFHQRLVSIHPFTDGNGRTARILTNLFLQKRGLAPILIRIDERNRYLDCLSKADHGEIDALTAFFAEKILNT